MIGIRRCRRMALFVFSLSLVFLPDHSLSAKGLVVTDGVTGLLANQAPSGLWGENGQTPFRDTDAVLVTLSKAAADATVLNEGLAAADALSMSTVDYLSRRIVAHAVMNETESVAAMIDSLASMQDVDGGWGGPECWGECEDAVWMGRGGGLA